MNRSGFVLKIIVIAQFACTSLWFACNALLLDLINNFGLQETVLGHLTASIQFGFIIGTLCFALLNIVDRFSPSKVFFFSALIAAIFNLGMVWENNTQATLLFLRFGTGFFLAGIYPVGMKIAADYFDKGLGRSLGFLVGALVLGTSFPHFLKGCSSTIPWQWVCISTSVLSVIGGTLIYLLVPDGPYCKPQKKLELTAFLRVFKDRKFRVAAFGYFGHMWELYTFWTFVPIILVAYQTAHPEVTYNVPILSFTIIAIGALSCVLGSLIAERLGTKKTAFLFLLLSGLCCLVFPIFYYYTSVNVFLLFLIIWGMVVIADSPLFSTLVAQSAEVKIKGTALTIVNCFGFAITIFSIEFFNIILGGSNNFYFLMLLGLGPLMAHLMRFFLDRS